MKHTIAKYFAAAAALCLTVVGCSTLQEDKGVSESCDIKFSASIGSFQVKATDTAFENGDAMGLFAENKVKAENIKLTWQDGALTPETPVRWGWDQLVDESALFYAYYPYTAQPVFVEDYVKYLEFSVQTDQSTHAAYTASDLMTASTYATPAEGSVNFAFVHRMAKLVLTVDNRLNDPVKEVYVGNVQTTGHYDIARSQDYYSLGERGSIKAGEGVTAEGAKAWSVILPSQDCQITLMLVTESGKEYVYKSENYVYFAAARRYTAQVILDETAISASFSATVYDWIDSGDFWFKQPNTQFDGEWSMIGTIGGSNWDRDLILVQTENEWFADVTLHAGEKFKFRMDASWDVNFGAPEGAANLSGKQGKISLVQGGADFMVEEDGLYLVYINLEEGYMGYYNRTLPEAEGTKVWEGVVLVTDWISHGFGTPDMWIANGLKVGDEIRIYYEAHNFDHKNYWQFQVADGHFSQTNKFDNYYYNFNFGYVSIPVTESWYNALTNVEGADFGMYILGDNIVITAITIAEASITPVTGWSVIGSIMGYTWDDAHDFPMENWADWGQANRWAINITSKVGDEFKFRMDGDWAENLGKNSDWTITEDPYGTGSYYFTCPLVQDGPNIQLPFDGNWDLILNTDDNTLTAIYSRPDQAAISSISEAVYAPDDSKVIIQAQVYALSSRGFVIYDGKYGLFVYTGSTAPTCQIGDIVIVQGYKTTYNNVPEITNTDLVVYTVKSGVDMQFQPSYSDITGSFNEPLFEYAAPIVYEGVLQLNGTKNVITVDGATMTGEAYWPAESLNLASLNGHYVRVYGFYNGYKQSVQYIIVNGVEDKGEAVVPTYTPEGDGSAENPFNATAAYEAASALEGDATIEKVYIKGTVSSVKYTYSAKYGTATFFISDDGSATAPQFQIYSTYYFNNTAWAEGDNQIAVGDKVIIYGDIMNYGGNTPETVSKKSWLVELNGYRPE